MTLTVSANGAEIPALGFGTFQMEGLTCEEMVTTALQSGCRHIDTAQIYGNEEHVGRAIARSQTPREDLFVTTKVWMDNYTLDDFVPSVRESLDKLQLDHVDLLLLHWPSRDGTIEAPVEWLNDAAEKGLTKHIGLSNHTVNQMERAIRASDRPFVTNQCEYHPFIDQTAVLQKTRGHGAALTAYCPLARGNVFSDKTIGEIAETHGKEPSQIVLRWLIQQPQVIAIPKSTNGEHVEDNMDIHDFALTPQEMGRITALNRNAMRLIDPDFAPDWDAQQAA